MHGHLNVKCILCVVISQFNQYFSFPKFTQVTVRHETIKKNESAKKITGDKMAQLKPNPQFSSYKLAVLFITPVGERDSDQHTRQLTPSYVQKAWYSKLMTYLCEMPLICIKTFSIVTEYKTYKTFRKNFAFEKLCCEFYSQ